MAELDECARYDSDPLYQEQSRKELERRERMFNGRYGHSRRGTKNIVSGSEFCNADYSIV